MQLVFVAESVGGKWMLPKPGKNYPIRVYVDGTIEDDFLSHRLGTKHPHLSLSRSALIMIIAEMLERDDE